MFERSRVPMALVDRECRFAAANDAVLELFGCTREEVIGTYAGRAIVDADSTLGDRLWQQLLRTNELYAEHAVAHPDGKSMLVSYAGHGTTISGRWLALIVTLSARFEPDGAELIGTADAEWPNDGGLKLTPREREVVRRLALGASSRQIAADLYLSPATVRSHVRNAMVKTGAHTRAQLVAIVLGEGLTSG